MSRARCFAAGVLVLCVLGIASQCLAIGQTTYVRGQREPADFTIVADKDAAPIYVDSGDFWGVGRAAGDLRDDVNRVSGITPNLVHDAASAGANPIIIGTVGNSALIDQLIREKKIDAQGIAGKWESFFLQVVANPLPGMESALVIAGSDKRGTIYGIYDLSEQIGVSPWYWWADVSPRHSDALFVKAGKYQQGEPSVKYRGIFLNDESPDLTNWVREKFGTIAQSADPPIPANVANYNSKFYARMFELLLRIKGNYLWPAMWNNAFNEDDPQNPKLADAYGIVMGTSHQEPMLRAQKEWDRRFQRTLGAWNYYRNPDALNKFWRDGVSRNKNYESIITIGLRGANDTEMIPGGTVQQSMDLLGKIIDSQRKIIAEEVNPAPAKVPQLWCPYKEVLDYYNAGFRVPDDVTILWTDDNWGNLRRLPTADERKRSGGAGIYYHFDYHGGPRNYQWVNSTQISKVYDQMSLAKAYGADRIWIVNVGHFKGQELPTEYSMDLAWNTDSPAVRQTHEFTRQWAQREFGPDHADEIADIVSQYTRYNNRRKPELLSPETYSLVNYHEADRVVADYDGIVSKAERIYAGLPREDRDAFYELVLFPVRASAQVNEIYVDAARNALYAQQHRASTNGMAAEVQRLFKADADLTADFNTKLAGGKWDHFMDQLHIGYTTWNEPRQNTPPRTVQIIAADAADMGIAVEGSLSAWPASAGVAPSPAALPAFDSLNMQKHYIELFNRGKTPFDFTIAASDPWIVPTETKGTVKSDREILIGVDWDRITAEKSSGTLSVMGPGGTTAAIRVDAFKPPSLAPPGFLGFVERDGYTSIEGADCFQNLASGEYRWEKIDDYGRTVSGMRSVAPVDAPAITPGGESARLEYRAVFLHGGEFKANIIVGPTLNFVPGRGLRMAVSIDDSPPQVLTIVPENFNAQNGNREWEDSVRNSVRTVQCQLPHVEAGAHTLKIWMVDPAVVVEKIVIDTGGLKPSYLGPPEGLRM